MSIEEPAAIVLRPISAAAAAALLEERKPSDVRVAEGYPTEFSTGVAASAGEGPRLGPFFIHRAADDVVVGEIGGASLLGEEELTFEIGYAIVAPLWGHGFATAAVEALVRLARERSDVEALLAHTPLDRPASGRVLEKAGFVATGQVDDEHEGVVLRVNRWELALGPQR